MATLYASSESIIMSDKDSAYAPFNRVFVGYQTVIHSKAFSLPDGTNNNQAESFILNRRVRWAIKGVYLSASDKYLKGYAVEQAWRYDTPRLSTGTKLRHLLQVEYISDRDLVFADHNAAVCLHPPLSENRRLGQTSACAAFDGRFRHVENAVLLLCKCNCASYNF